MPSSGMWRCVALVRNYVLEELVTSIFRLENPRSEEHRYQLASRPNHQYEKH
jgi:hypothetical protein